MFASEPRKVLRRTIMIRLLLSLFVLPVGLLAAWGFWASLKEREIVASAVFGVVALAVLALFGHFFRREGQREVRLHDEGIVQVIGANERSIRWADVTEVWFEAIRVQAGGLIGAAVGAAVQAAQAARGRSGRVRDLQQSWRLGNM